MKKSLDKKNIELTKIIHELKQALDIYLLIGLNTKEINKKGGKTFFAMAQRLALKSFVIDICKIFEEKKKNKLNSIPSIINFIQGTKLKPDYPKLLHDFITKYDEKVKKDGCFSEPLINILTKFKNKHKKAFKEYKTIRDSKFVHTEDNANKKINTLPSYDTMEKILFFAIDFYSVIHESYIGGYPVQHKRERKTFAGLHTVLKNMGYSEVKIKLEN